MTFPFPAAGVGLGLGFGLAGGQTASALLVADWSGSFGSAASELPAMTGAVDAASKSELDAIFFKSWTVLSS